MVASREPGELEQDPVEVVGRLGARLILQQALEDEVTEFLGRQRYQRAGETVSHRNGHEPKTIKTTSGSMNVERPQVRDAGKLGLVSKILGKGVARTHVDLNKSKMEVRPHGEGSPEREVSPRSG
jgi:putative transposase